MDKVVVTGVNGFVGGHLVDALTDAGYAAIGVGREESPRNNVLGKLDSYVSCDLSDYDQVKNIDFSTARAVINLAGLAAVGPSFEQPDLYMRINTAVLDTVCQAVIEQGNPNIRIISISSGAIYSSDQPLPLTEDSQLAPESSPYAASKIAMEELSHKYRTAGLDCIIARPFNHIGPGQMSGFLLPDLYTKIIDSLNSHSKLLVGNLTTRRDYTDVRDVAKAYVALVSAESLKDSTYNVCSGEALSGEQILKILLKEMNARDLHSEVDEALFRPSDSQELYGDSSRLATATGWAPEIDIDQTIRDFISSKESN